MDGSHDDISKNWKPQTALVRGGLERSSYQETCEALYLTSGFVYDTAEEAEAAFKGDHKRYIYGRYGNPTVAAFEERLRRRGFSVALQRPPSKGLRHAVILARKPAASSQRPAASQGVNRPRASARSSTKRR